MGTASDLIHRTVSVATGVTLHLVERPGAGPPVICLHGIWGTWRAWEPLTRPGPGFAGRSLLLVDLRGHGDSSKPETGYTLSDYAADVIGLIDTIDAERVTLAGHSLGALVAIVAARRSPDRIASLLLEEPPLPIPFEYRNLNQFWHRFVQSVFGYSAIKHSSPRLVIQQLLDWESVATREEATDLATRIIQTADGVFDVIKRDEFKLDAITTPGPPLDMPTLVFQGADPDWRGLADAGVTILRRLFPRLRVEIIPETRHGIFETAPDVYRTTIADFFGS